ncbi:hypothetical protein LSTR_LSTR003266 [Laodelphax striatellus]|uniref:Uncharacterized protein n=1 Tax=Laodelphax striatellus TaxID=195883 RepID=A0A482XSS0_LAOST|nr:hypothetical protein LSTR_LSTR003266 [Laodelphax striatellus]
MYPLYSNASQPRRPLLEPSPDPNEHTRCWHLVISLLRRPLLQVVELPWTTIHPKHGKRPTPEQSSVIPIFLINPVQKVTTATSLLTYVEPVNQSLEKSWETEEVPVKAKKDHSHMYCENPYTETTTLWPSDRHEVAPTPQISNVSLR